MAKVSSSEKPTHAKNADLSPQKRRFVEWLISEEKVPARQGELAAEMGVDQSTLSDWKRDPAVVKLLAEIEAGFAAEKARAVANLVRIATQGKDAMAAVAAFRELAKVFGWNKPEKVEHTGRMTLADFLAAGGYSKDEAAQVARPN